MNLIILSFGNGAEKKQKKATNCLFRNIMLPRIGKKWGKSVICGLARLDGIAVAIFAEDPMVYGGAWTADACRKLIRHCDLASTFHLPLVHLVDCPGFLIGKQSEDNATIRLGSQAL